MTDAPSAPPQHLNQDLELGATDWPAQDLYFLLTGLVIPRPIGWVSSVSNEGVHNIAPYSYFNAMGHQPPTVVFGSGGRKDSVRNIEQNGEFVINIVSMDLLEKMNFTSTDFPPEESEFSWAGLAQEPATTVKPFRVGEAKAHFECQLVQIVTVGNAHIVIGEVKHLHVRADVWRDGRVDPKLLDPACRLSGSWYASLGKLIYLKRPKWTDVANSHGTERMPRVAED